VQELSGEARANARNRFRCVNQTQNPPFADWNSLPPFLLCDEHTGRDDHQIFVLHTHTPRFLMEFVHDSEGEFFLIDPPTPDLPDLKAQAVRFFEGMLG